jgi:hypothetical protein
MWRHPDSDKGKFIYRQCSSESPTAVRDMLDAVIRTDPHGVFEQIQAATDDTQFRALSRNVSPVILNTFAVLLQAIDQAVCAGECRTLTEEFNKAFVSAHVPEWVPGLDGHKTIFQQIHELLPREASADALFTAASARNLNRAKSRCAKWCKDNRIVVASRLGVAANGRYDWGAGMQEFWRTFSETGTTQDAVDAMRETLLAQIA